MKVPTVIAARHDDTGTGIGCTAGETLIET